MQMFLFTSSAETMTRHMSHSTSFPQTVPGHQQHLAQQSPVSSPSSLPQSPPINPWQAVVKILV